MKNTLALALALIMVFALAACGGKTESAPAGSAPASSAPAASQQTEQQPSEAADGNGNMPNIDGESWPENKWTALIPEPTDVIVTSGEDVDNTMATGYRVTLSNWTVEAAKAYTEQVANAGFDIPSIGDNVVFQDDDSGYNFIAKNSDGVEVDIAIVTANGFGLISISEYK